MALFLELLSVCLTLSPDYDGDMKTFQKDLHYGDMFQNDPYVRKRIEQYCNYMIPKINEGTTILDVGGYMGDTLGLLAQKCEKQFQYHLVDFDDKALEIARERGAHVYKTHLDTESIDKYIPNLKFDIILCTEVLEHTLNPHKHIQKIKELLKDNGLCIISLPNENSIFHRLMSVIGSGVDQCAFELYKHLHLPTISQSKNFVSEYFKIKNISYYINPSLKASRASWLGSLLTLFPDTFWCFFG